MIYFTYVNIEIGVVNINSVSSLTEVDMANSAITDIVIVDKTISCLWKGLLQPVGGCSDVVTRADIVIPSARGSEALAILLRNGVALGIFGYLGKAI